MRNGYCEVPPSDYGNHGVAGTSPSRLARASGSRGRTTGVC